jgi:hypothetical protein
MLRLYRFTGKNETGGKMFRITAAALSLLIALAGCDGGETPERNVTKITVGKDNPYHRRMLEADETSRMLALRRAIQDDGGSCRHIKSSSYQQQYQGLEMWVARCDRGDWAVYIAPSGIIQARACKDARQLGLPECRGTPEAAADGPVWTNQSNPVPPAGTR